jgi:DNA-binding NtrC family response regulator
MPQSNDIIECMDVLIVDDEMSHRQYLAEVLRDSGYKVREAGDGKEALDVLMKSPVDVLVTDLLMPRMDGFDLLRTLRAEDRMVPSIVMTAFGSIEKAIATIHDLGGFWFLEKPIDTEALKVLLERACVQTRLSKEIDLLKRQLASSGALGDLVGRSHAMMEIFDLIRQVAPTKASVLLTGESGTGKELVARALHNNSRRSQGPYVALNCAAMPESLMESELFGHEKGAFTGAFERRIGSLEAASGGTLFLDEIGEMPMPMQAKLLRVLEDFTFRRLGSRVELTADVRLVAATNKDPLKAIQEGKFREDLYYRLNVFHIKIPPLRERKEDIPLLVEAMIHNLNSKHGTRVTDAGSEFLAALHKRNWEGNVRELRNIVERAVILTGCGTIQHSGSTFENQMQAAAKPVAQESIPQTPETDGITFRPGTKIEDAERVLIESTLAYAGMNKTRAASMLGITTKTLHSKLRTYKMSDQGNVTEDQAGLLETAARSVGSA